MSASTKDFHRTALILITGASKPGIEAGFRKTLAPFFIEIIDIQTMDIRDRFFLAGLISLDPAHAKAIEADLQDYAAANDMDLAIDLKENI